MNALARRDYGAVEDVTDYIGELEPLLGMDQSRSVLMLLDSAGNCYDASGKHGVWPDIDQISGGEERYAFISNTEIYEGSHWAFVQKFDTPLQVVTDGISYTHAVLLKDVYTLTDYYDSAAYGGHNLSYPVIGYYNPKGAIKHEPENFNC